MGPSKPGIRTEIIPYIFYRDVPAALAWLARAFGFTEEMRHAMPSGMHAQMTCHGQRIMMGQGSKEWTICSATPAMTMLGCSCRTWPLAYGDF